VSVSPEKQRDGEPFVPLAIPITPVKVGLANFARPKFATPTSPTSCQVVLVEASRIYNLLTSVLTCHW